MYIKVCESNTVLNLKNVNYFDFNMDSDNSYYVDANFNEDSRIVFKGTKDECKEFLSMFRANDLQEWYNENKKEDSDKSEKEAVKKMQKEFMVTLGAEMKKLSDIIDAKPKKVSDKDILESFLYKNMKEQLADLTSKF